MPVTLIFTVPFFMLQGSSWRQDTLPFPPWCPWVQSRAQWCPPNWLICGEKFRTRETQVREALFRLLPAECVYLKLRMKEREETRMPCLPLAQWCSAWFKGDRECCRNSGAARAWNGSRYCEFCGGSIHWVTWDPGPVSSSNKYVEVDNHHCLLSALKFYMLLFIIVHKTKLRESFML